MNVWSSSSAECRVKRAGERARERESYRGREVKCHIKRAGGKERVSYRRRETKRDKKSAEKTRVRLREERE